MIFEQWWSQHAIEKAEILPVLKLSFKELAKTAWESALFNNPIHLCPNCGCKFKDIEMNGVIVRGQARR